MAPGICGSVAVGAVYAMWSMGGVITCPLEEALLLFLSSLSPASHQPSSLSPASRQPSATCPLPSQEVYQKYLLFAALGRRNVSDEQAMREAAEFECPVCMDEDLTVDVQPPLTCASLGGGGGGWICCCLERLSGMALATEPPPSSDTSPRMHGWLQGV